MNDIEDRLRAAYYSATETVSPDTLRGLDEPVAVISYPARRTASRWLVPLGASAAAAAVIVALAVVVPSVLRTGRPAADQGAATSGGPAAHFLMAVGGGRLKSLTVHNVMTGLAVAGITSTAKISYTAAATGNGLTYFAAYSKKGSCGSWLQEFTIGRHGQFTTNWVPFAVRHVDETVGQLAVSENGKVVALAGDRCARGHEPVLTAVNLATKTSRQWLLSGLVPSVQEVPSLSLDSDGARLVFTTGLPGLRLGGVYLLDTRSEPGPVYQPSRQIVKELAYGKQAQLSSAAITPGGRTVYFGINNDSRVRKSWELRSVEVTTGRVRLIAGIAGYVGNVAVNPSATEALAFAQEVRVPGPVPSASPTPVPSGNTSPATSPHPTQVGTPVPSRAPTPVPSGSATPVPSRSPVPTASPSPSGSPLPSEAAVLAAYVTPPTRVLRINLVHDTAVIRPGIPWQISLFRYVW